MKSIHIILVILVLSCFSCDGAEVPGLGLVQDLKKMHKDILNNLYGKEKNIISGPLKNVFQAAVENKDVITAFNIDLKSNFDLKNNFLAPLAFLKMGDKLSYESAMGQVSSAVYTKTSFDPKINTDIINAIKEYVNNFIKDYVDNFTLFAAALQLPIVGMPICEEKSCDKNLSERWSMIVHNYLRKRPGHKHFQFLDDAETAFVAINSEVERDLVGEQEKAVTSFKDSLIQMFTDNQVAQVLGVYSKSFEKDGEIQHFIDQYILLTASLFKGRCLILQNILNKSGKSELLAQLLYFIITSKYEISTFWFKNYLANTQMKLIEKNPCYSKLFSDLLLRIKKSDYLETILMRIADLTEVPQGTRELYIRQITEKIASLEAGGRGGRIKEYLNPLYSFMTKNKGRLGFFTAAFIAFYFGYLKNVLKRVRTSSPAKG